MMVFLNDYPARAVRLQTGDIDFKRPADRPPEEQMVSCVPHVTVKRLGPGRSLLVLASDGVWDCRSSRAVVVFFRSRLARACLERGLPRRGREQRPLSDHVRDLLHECKAKDPKKSLGGGCDNMTGILVVVETRSSCFSALRLWRRGSGRVSVTK
jgi:serine/threonine protein phosphatase PrpC